MHVIITALGHTGVPGKFAATARTEVRLPRLPHLPPLLSDRRKHRSRTEPEQKRSGGSSRCLHATLARDDTLRGPCISSAISLLQVPAVDINVVMHTVQPHTHDAFEVVGWPRPSVRRLRTTTSGQAISIHVRYEDDDVRGGREDGVGAVRSRREAPAVSHRWLPCQGRPGFVLVFIIIIIIVIIIILDALLVGVRFVRRSACDERIAKGQG